MDGTIIVRGNFTSTGVNKTIVFRPGVNWITVYNMIANDGVGAPLQFYFQTGMTNGIAIDGVGATTAPAGMFTVIDYSNPANFASIQYSTTVQTSAVLPLVTSAATLAAAAVKVGDVVRITGRNTAGVLGVPVFGNYGVDMIVSIVGAPNAANVYTLLGAENQLATASGVAGTDGALQRIDISSVFYPANRIVTNISQVAGVITVATSVPHGMTVGQSVRFKIPTVCGATISALLDARASNNYVSAVVTSVIANAAPLAAFGSLSFTIDIVGSGEAFTYPTSAQVGAGSQLPEMIPFGQDTAYSVSQNANILADATVNQGFVGITLRAGAARANNPAGQTGDVIFWKVGACFNSQEYA
jgi:hypothetical protein